MFSNLGVEIARDTMAKFVNCTTLFLPVFTLGGGARGGGEGGGGVGGGGGRIMYSLHPQEVTTSTSSRDCLLTKKVKLLFRSQEWKLTKEKEKEKNFLIEKYLGKKDTMTREKFFF